MVWVSAMGFAGISSLQNMFEAVGESLQNRFPKLKCSLLLMLLGVVCLGAGPFMEPIYSWGPWMDTVSIFIIPVCATLCAISWFWVMKKDQFMGEINKGSKRMLGNVWYYTGRYIYVPCALILCLVALFMQIAF